MPSPALPRIASVGECMIELRHLGANKLELGFGGDTFNTAVYLVRAGRNRGLKVDYATALGDDPYSEEMRAFFACESVGTSLVVTVPGRLPGLYAIRTDSRGERSFSYWRGESAARAMLDGRTGAALADRLRSYDWIYLSGITLSILGEAARRRLMEALDWARTRGGRIAFDSNFRPRGWPGPDAARTAFLEIFSRVDLALPSFSDEQTLFGDADPRATARRLHECGVGEVVVKNGSAPALASDGRNVVEIGSEPNPNVVDTTAAGDAFNGAYLAARVAGHPIDHAVRCGHRLAGVVIQHRGAIIPANATPELL